MASSPPSLVAVPHGSKRAARSSPLACLFSIAALALLSVFAGLQSVVLSRGAAAPTLRDAEFSAPRAAAKDWQPPPHGHLAPPPVGVARPCAAPLPRTATCNTHKVIPSLDDDMPPLWRAPPAGGARWGPLEAGYKGSGGCCLVSDIYRFIFVRTHKAAGSSLTSFLQTHACPKRNGSSSSMSTDTCLGANFRPPHAKVCPLDAMHPESNVAQGGCADIPRWKWLSYYVFAAVRHPLSRAVSAYHFCNKSLSTTFAEYCVNPDHGNWCSRVPTIDPKLTDELLSNVIKEPLPQLPAWAPGEAKDKPDLHWMAQSMQLCGARGCLPDFFARVEFLDKDLDIIVKSINAVRSFEFPELPRFSDWQIWRNKVNVQADDLFARSENSHCRAALLAWYAEDYERLGYARLDAETGHTEK